MKCILKVRSRNVNAPQINTLRIDRCFLIYLRNSCRLISCLYACVWRCTERPAHKEVSSYLYELELSLKITRGESVCGASAIGRCPRRRCEADSRMRRVTVVVAWIYRKSIRVNLRRLTMMATNRFPPEEVKIAEWKSVTKTRDAIRLARMWDVSLLNDYANIIEDANRIVRKRNRFVYEQSKIDSTAELVTSQRDPRR